MVNSERHLCSRLKKPLNLKGLYTNFRPVPSKMLFSVWHFSLLLTLSLKYWKYFESVLIELVDIFLVVSLYRFCWTDQAFIWKLYRYSDSLLKLITYYMAIFLTLSLFMQRHLGRSLFMLVIEPFVLLIKFSSFTHKVT